VQITETTTHVSIAIQLLVPIFIPFSFLIKVSLNPKFKTNSYMVTKMSAIPGSRSCPRHWYLHNLVTTLCR